MKKGTQFIAGVFVLLSGVLDASLSLAAGGIPRDAVLHEVALQGSCDIQNSQNTRTKLLKAAKMLETALREVNVVPETISFTILGTAKGYRNSWFAIFDSYVQFFGSPSAREIYRQVLFTNRGEDFRYYPTLYSEILQNIEDCSSRRVDGKTTTMLVYEEGRLVKLVFNDEEIPMTSAMYL
jgi:hypothetical protein